MLVQPSMSNPPFRFLHVVIAKSLFDAPRKLQFPSMRNACSSFPRTQCHGYQQRPEADPRSRVSCGTLGPALDAGISLTPRTEPAFRDPRPSPEIVRSHSSRDPSGGRRLRPQQKRRKACRSASSKASSAPQKYLARGASRALDSGRGQERVERSLLPKLR